MGAASSKSERSEALRLCKERKRFIKQAVDSRYALAAAHVSYVESLRNIGIALRRYAEAEVLIESSLSTSATELDKTPSHSSYPSPSPSHVGGVSDSPVLNGSPLSPPIATRLSYMRSAGPTAVTVKVSPSSTNMYVDDVDFSTPLPPPPPPDSGSWDFFDPTDNESFRFVTHNGRQLNFDELGEKDNEGDNGIQEEFLTPKSEPRSNGHGKLEFHDSSPVMPKRAENNSQQVADGEGNNVRSEPKANGSVGTTIGKSALQVSVSKGDKPSVDEREDPSEFITHRAKDFLSSIKDIEHRFFRASESGKEISRMLEASKIRVGFSEAKGITIS